METFLSDHHMAHTFSSIRVLTEKTNSMKLELTGECHRTLKSQTQNSDLSYRLGVEGLEEFIA